MKGNSYSDDALEPPAVALLTTSKSMGTEAVSLATDTGREELSSRGSGGIAP